VQHVPTNEASPNIGVLTSRSAVESTRDHAIDSLTRAPRKTSASPALGKITTS
jgi:hypothetical protein